VAEPARPAGPVAESFFARLRRRAEHALWGAPHTAGARGTVVRAVRVAVTVGADLLAGRLTLHAMSLVYTTLLSLVPLLAVSFSVLKAFDVHYQVAPLLERFLDPLGPQSAEITGRVLGFVENVRGGVLGAVGVAMLFYTVVSVLQKVESAFNEIWRVGRTRGFSRRFSDYLSVLIVGPVLVFSALGITASALSHGLVRRAMEIAPLGTVIVAGTRALPYVLVIAAFAFIYVFLTNTRVRVLPALVGAVVAGALWQTTGWVFGTFVVGSGRYAAVYSGFAILLLFLIWLYLSWLILLVGSSVAFYAQHPHLARPGALRGRLGEGVRERLGLGLMYLVARQHLEGCEPVTVAQAAQVLGIAPEIVEDLAATLCEGALLARSEGQPPGLLPARDPGRIALGEIIGRLREGDIGSAVRDTPVPAVDAALAAREHAAAKALEGRTLRDLVLDAQRPAQS
jgi:membrane protein